MDYTIDGHMWDAPGGRPRAEPGDARNDTDRDDNDKEYADDDDDDGDDRALIPSDESDDQEDPLWWHRRRRDRGPRLTRADERRVSIYLAIATVVFFAAAIGLGAANYYSPLACFGQRHHIEDADRPRMTPTEQRHSWIVLASAFFACGTTSLVALGLIVVGVIGCASVSLRVSRVLACVF